MNDPQPEGHIASDIGRRKFLATLGGGAVAWPLAARAQQTGKTHTIGLLSPASRSPSDLPALFDAPWRSWDGSKEKTSSSNAAMRRIGPNGCPNSQQS